ncbi:hypothetical protein NQ318_015374 [Aromia moschata]|uniref:C2H2-type domain-containing protein n=1 Tax=Aromia moschata TaxID=1265417 RepID=A0AAV8YPY8_9CUCU|nr:hypothetical protein NQ318_015374 [Aromia moschata]
MVPENTYINAQFYSPDIGQKGKRLITLKPNDIIFRQPQHSLTLKQICTNVPKCEFVTVEQQQILRKQNLFAESVLNTPNVEIKQEPPEEPTPTVTMPIISKVESLQDKMFKLPRCLECNAFQRGTMAEHYLGKDQPVDTALKCTTCRFVASTKCSLKAHVRIHETLPPYVCPDCGKDFPSWDQLRKHMDEVCFHLAKHVRFRCPGKKCGKLFAMSSTFAAHFQIHLKCCITCSVCSTVLFKWQDAEAHRKVHEGPCAFKKVYDCPLCPQMGSLSEENFKAHVDMHTTDTSRCMYVYLCKYCRSYFRSTTTYATHILKCSTKQSNVSHMKKFDMPKYVTKDCETCPSKIIFNEEKPVRFCNKCKIQAQRSNKTATAKRYFCVLCNKQILMHEKSMHMKECKYGKPLVIVPKLSIDDIENRSFSSNSSDSLSSPTKSEKLRRRKSFDSSKGDDGMKKKRKRVNINNNKHRRSEKETELDLTADEPMQFDGTYHCRLCNYKSISRSEFHGHIKSHRDISTAYQCMECAECFVVKPSLIKHLVHYHNISDHESYLRENDCYDIEAVKELEDTMKLAPGESKEPVKENQCRVCRQQFSDAVALNKHFRIHGMAFLLRNIK